MSPLRAALCCTAWPVCPEWLATSPRLARVPSRPGSSVRVDVHVVKRYYRPGRYDENRLNSVRDAEIAFCAVRGITGPGTTRHVYTKISILREESGDFPRRLFRA
jgi:hypothetical protein